MTALAAVALLSLVSAVTLVVLATRRRGRAEIDALARAVRLVRESAGGPSRTGAVRPTCSRASRVRDRGGLAAEATRIAWAPPDPTADTVEELAAHAARESG